MTLPRTLTALAATLLLTACGGGDDPAAPSSVADASGGTDVVAGDLFYEPTELRAGAGEVSITIDNEGSAVHNVVIEEAGDTTVVEAEGGASDTGTIELEAGSYTFYCDIPGHRAAGMEGTLIVTE